LADIVAGKDQSSYSHLVMSFGRLAAMLMREGPHQLLFSSQFYALFLLQVFIVTQLVNTAMMMSM
jgi:hypothetical protein